MVSSCENLVVDRVPIRVAQAARGVRPGSASNRVARPGFGAMWMVSIAAVSIAPNTQTTG